MGVEYKLSIWKEEVDEYEDFGPPWSVSSHMLSYMDHKYWFVPDNVHFFFSSHMAHVATCGSKEAGVDH
jgi:hypothetical protein